MNLQSAIELLAFENTNPLPQLWLDLGCGTGLFTLALANYLPARSKIIAVDKDKNALSRIPKNINNTTIETITADFIHDALDVKEVDGILMANSLHYVKDKETFLHKLVRLMKTNAVFLIVEYDRKVANQWVPFPLTISDAKALFKSVGYSNFHILNTRPSGYGSHNLYAAIIH